MVSYKHLYLLIIISIISLLIPSFIFAQTNSSINNSAYEIPLDELDKLRSSQTSKMFSQPNISTTQNAEELNLGQLQYIAYNGDPADKLDILFIPQRMVDIASVSALIQKVLYIDDTSSYDFDGLLQRPPFNQFQNKFNVAYVDQNIDETYFDCWLEVNPEGIKWNLAHGCNEYLIKSVYGKFKPDYIVILFKLPVGYHSQGGEIMYLQSDTGLQNGLDNYVAWTFTHEFAHQFGGLADEYTLGPGTVSYYCGYASDPSCFTNYYKGISIIPNLDQVGCPKWCSSFDLTLLQQDNNVCAQHANQTDCLAQQAGPGSNGCNWFNLPHPVLGTNCVTSQSWSVVGTQCSENVECVYGADYGQLAFKPNKYSMMSGGQFLNEVSVKHLQNSLDCCYPRSNSNECQQFLNQFNNPPQEANYYLRIALKKIAYCPKTCELNSKSLISNFYDKVTCANVNLKFDEIINSLDFAKYVQ